MGPHDKSDIIIELGNIFYEVQRIFTEDHVKNIVTKL